RFCFAACAHQLEGCSQKNVLEAFVVSGILARFRLSFPLFTMNRGPGLPSPRTKGIFACLSREVESMKLFLASAALAVVLTNPAFAATSDDAKWVAKCVGDNAGAKNVTVEIITSYCTCMNNEMDDNETL